MLAGSLATASSVLWTGCSAGEGIGSSGAALGAKDTSGGIVISGVYGAGGNEGGTLNADYVELFNSGSQAVSVNGWSIQYAASTGTFTTVATESPLKLPDATIEPGQFFLVSMAVDTKYNGAALPASDATGTLNFAATAGSVFLVNNTTQLTCAAGQCGGVASIVDTFGYGTAVDFAGTVAPALSLTMAAIRIGDGDNDGCTNTDNNKNDFAIVTVTATTPRNSKTAVHTCAGTTGPVTGGKGLVISQLYPNGGYADSAFPVDFVELFNTTTTPLALDGLTLRSTSANGAFSDADGGAAAYLYTTLPTGVSVAPGGYYLVALQGGKSDAGAALPMADYNDTQMSLSGTGGKIAIVSAADTLNGCGKDGGPCPLGDFVDLVGYGAAASEFEGTGPAPAPGNTDDTDSIQRGGAGCTTTSDNSKDFALATAAPHNSSSSAHPCGGGGAMDAGTDGGADASADSGSDASSDGGAEGGGGGGQDASVDSGTDASTGGKDSGTDASGGGGGGGADNGSSGLVISQVYGAGGDNFDADYVEIFNRGTSAVSLDGLSLQYGSATGDFAVTYGDAGDTNLVVLPNKSVPAGGYFLVGLALGDAGAALPTADFTGEANMSATNGKVAIVNGTTALSSCGPAGTLCPTSDFVDLIGYGTASQFEGTQPAPALDYTHAALRGDNGCTDTDENSTDITSGTPAPRNSSTALNLCTNNGGGGGKADSGTSKSDGGNSDSGTSGDDDNGDDDSSDSGTSGTKGTASGSDSGGCSTAGTTSTGNGAASFGLFAFAVLALGGRRKKSAKRA